MSAGTDFQQSSIVLSEEIRKIIKTTAIEVGAVMVEKIGVGLSEEITQKIKPMQKSKVDYLMEENEKLRNDIYYLNQLINTIENKNTYCLRVVKKSKIKVQNLLMEGLKENGNRQESSQ